MLSPKEFTQKVLRRVGLYNRFKGSRLYTAYWTVMDRSLVDSELREVDFYRSVLTGLGRGGLIFDIGANLGYKTDIFLRLGARVVSVDPDEENKKILEEKFLKYRFTPRPVIIVNKAMSDANSVETMWVDEPGSAKNTFSRKWVDILRTDEDRFGHKLTFGERRQVVTSTLDDLITTYGLPHFIKIDVEGYEPTVLKGLNKPVPYISFEVNLPEFRSEGLECIELLRRLSGEGLFNYAVDCRKGLAQKEWVGADAFAKLLSQSTEKSVDVFWKSPSAAQA
jgi:FkbM family methyltransferase